MGRLAVNYIKEGAALMQWTFMGFPIQKGEIILRPRRSRIYAKALDVRHTGKFENDTEIEGEILFRWKLLNLKLQNLLFLNGLAIGYSVCSYL